MMNTFLRVPNQSASNLHTPVLFGEILIGSNTIFCVWLKESACGCYRLVGHFKFSVL